MVFNIKGNDCRLIVVVQYEDGVAMIRFVGSYCGRFDPQVGVTLIGYDEPTRSDEDLWAADLQRSKPLPCPYILGRHRRHNAWIAQLNLNACIRHFVGSIEKTDCLRAISKLLGPNLVRALSPYANSLIASLFRRWPILRHSGQETLQDKMRLKLAHTMARALCVIACLLHGARIAQAQAGPPFFTNDPGTPGNANWEINLGSMQTISRGSSSYQAPQIDLNFGLGDRIQLTYEIPYVLQSSDGGAVQSGWGNAYPGIKWRFLDQGEDGWQMSTFPQMETGGSQLARQKGIAVAGPRYLLPFEVTKKVGSLDVDFEAGYYFPGNGPKERVMGLVAGRSVNDRLELDAELYDDRVYGDSQHSTTLDIGGRYKLGTGVIALFMAGRSINGLSNGQPEFVGYVGVQILLSDYGRSFAADPAH